METVSSYTSSVPRGASLNTHIEVAGVGAGHRKKEVPLMDTAPDSTPVENEPTKFLMTFTASGVVGQGTAVEGDLK